MSETRRVRVVIAEHVPLRGAHDHERTGTMLTTEVNEQRNNQRGGRGVCAALDPDGKIGGPFYLGEYTVVGPAPDDEWSTKENAGGARSE